MALLLKWAGSHLIGRAGVIVAIVLIGITSAALISRQSIALKADRLQTDRDAWRTAAGRWEKAAGGWRASFEKAERLRSEEAATGLSAVAAASAACDARVDAARRSSRAIHDIVTAEVPLDEKTGCPRRGIVAGDRLRDALGAAR